MKTVDEVRKVVSDLSTSVWAFSALSASVEAGLLERLVEEEPLTSAYLSKVTGVKNANLVECILDVLVSLGLVRREGDAFVAEPGLMPLVTAPGNQYFPLQLRSTYLQSRYVIDQAKQGTLMPGWRFTDPEIVNAHGRMSVLGIQMLAEHLFPKTGWPS
jgi:hypothetical protein